VQYLGIDVHNIAGVRRLLDEDGEIRARGKVETTVPALGELVAELLRQGEPRVGQEVGTMAYLVHDAVAGAGAEILSFNAHQLWMIASSRKKTDRRDAYCIARALQIPGVATLTATTIYAWVGDVRRFPDAKSLAASAGLAPSIRQSGEMQRYGSTTKTGSKALRSTLVQAAHVLMNRCRSIEAKPLQAIGERVHTSRGRRKIATVALARHILRIACYLLRDGAVYDSRRLRAVPEAQDEAA
jgi:transposase